VAADRCTPSTAVQIGPDQRDHGITELDNPYVRPIP
jgi:hypothetical protein